MGEIRAILFDKDGTLFDFQASWGAWAQGVLDDFSGGDPVRADVLAWAIGFDRETARFAPSSVVIAGTNDEVADAMLPHLPAIWTRSAVARHLSDSAMAAPVREAVPLEPFLASLRQAGYGLGLVTNDAEAPARAHLAAAGIEAAFGFIAGYDSGHGAKPAPGPLLAGAAVLGADPGATLMVGDSLHDLIAGQAAGMRTVGVLTGLATRDELHPVATAVLPDIGHLPGWLSG